MDLRLFASIHSIAAKPVSIVPDTAIRKLAPLLVVSTKVHIVTFQTRA
jgi:hypothetical protein